jgi:SAM-dependent methyltransferase
MSTIYNLLFQSPICLMLSFSILAAEKSSTDIKTMIRKLHLENQQLVLIDDLLGIEYDQTEKKVQQKDYKYFIAQGYSKENSQTRYPVIRHFFDNNQLSKEDIFYDLGSGYGRVLFYGAALHPQTKFKGVEIVGERAAFARSIAKKGGFENVEIIHQDVLKADLSDGTIFYLFNPFPKIIDEVIKKLNAVAAIRKIRVVAVGETIKDLDKVKWLKRSNPKNNFGAFVFESI